MSGVPVFTQDSRDARGSQAHILQAPKTAAEASAANLTPGAGSRASASEPPCQSRRL